MKKATKGALAAAAAGTMLVGGYGSLATWTSQKTIDGGTIKAGQLSLSAPACTAGVGGHDWQYGPSDPYDFADEIVPGDSISKVCRVTLTGSGENLAAELVVAGADVADDEDTTFDTDLTASATFAVDGGAPTTGSVDFTSADFASDSTKDVLVTITVTFPSTVGDAPQAGDRDQTAQALLNDLTITANQT